LGIILAVSSGAAIEWKFKLLTVNLSSILILKSLILGFVVGSVGAFYPALLASRQDPLDALVYE